MTSSQTLDAVLTFERLERSCDAHSFRGLCPPWGRSPAEIVDSVRKDEKREQPFVYLSKESVPVQHKHCPTDQRLTPCLPHIDYVRYFSVQSTARFSDTGTSVLITFDNNTDYGAVSNLRGSFACPMLFVYPGASDLDACAWTSGGFGVCSCRIRYFILACRTND